jgi:hypothetical protein
VLQESKKPVDLSKIFLLRPFDRVLGQVVSEHILGIGPVHGVLPLFVPTPFTLQAITVTHCPLIEPVAIQEMLAQMFVLRSGL